MTINDTMRLLAQAPFLAVLGPEEMRLLAFAAEPLQLPAGRHVARAGETADAAYVLVHGVIAAVGADGRTLARHATPGTIIGELGLIVSTEWQTDLVADSATQVLRLPRAQFRRLLDDYPAAAEALRQRVAADVSRLADAMEPVTRRL
jgi:CRP-like cAMP-binding protein